MSIVTEGNRSVFFTTQARLVEDNREIAWAERTIVANSAYKFLIGNYVEANRANSNNQYWSLGDLKGAQSTIRFSPLNMLHHHNRVIGSLIDTEIVYPTGEDADATEQQPYVEVLGAIWKYYFPDELKIIEAAYSTANLFVSMECVSDSITCSGDNGCGETYDYSGPTSSSYCDHVNKGISVKQLNKPHFLGAGLIFPPERPGWKGAEVKEISELVKKYERECEMAYNQIAEENPHLNADQWEFLMEDLVSRAKRRDRKSDLKAMKRATKNSLD